MKKKNPSIWYAVHIKLFHISVSMTATQTITDTIKMIQDEQHIQGCFQEDNYEAVKNVNVRDALERMVDSQKHGGDDRDISLMDSVNLILSTL